MEGAELNRRFNSANYPVRCLDSLKPPIAPKPQCHVVEPLPPAFVTADRKVAAPFATVSPQANCSHRVSAKARPLRISAGPSNRGGVVPLCRNLWVCQSESPMHRSGSQLDSPGDPCARCLGGTLLPALAEEDCS